MYLEDIKISAYLNSYIFFLNSMDNYDIARVCHL